MPISSAELTQIRSKWYDRLQDYQSLSDYVVDRCLGFREQHPTVVRIVFSRQPKVKTLSSITQKIEARRRVPETPNFKYEDLSDIVALTVLCPYGSDTHQFIAWARTAFNLLTPVADAFKEYDSGHRGYHFVVTPTDAELAARPQLNGIRCEIQVKTLLQEAFDAKSHDLAYKPGHLEVGPDLQTQFALLSGMLNALDGQSEFLKRLILREQKELDLRRNACLELYLRRYGDMPGKLGLDPENLPDVVTVIQRLKDGALAHLSGDFCKFAGYCALKLDHPLLKDKTIEYADQWVAGNQVDVHRVFVRGATKWVLGRFEESFVDFVEVIERASSPDAPDPEEMKKAKNNLIYAVCDCKLFKRDVDEQWVQKVAPYVAELRAAEAGHEADTIGFYLIMFGKTNEEIEEGRRLLKTARKELVAGSPAEAEIHSRFFLLHDYVALNRLLSAARAAVSH